MKFATLYADPPWKFGNGWGWGASQYYKVMKLDDIKALAVPTIACDNAHLYLWAPNGMVPRAFEVMGAWGFTYKTMITWVKNRSIFGYYFKGQTEQLLFGVSGKLPVLDRRLVTKIDGVIGRHSAKPQAARELIERASPQPRIELFARGRVDGWYCWGNEVESDIEL